jgi:hypothetical protein
MVHPQKRRRKWPWITLAIIVLLIVGVQLALDPVVTWQTRKQLDNIEGYSSDFSDVKIRLWALEYEIDDLSMVKMSAGGRKEPFVALGSLTFAVFPRQLLNRQLVGRIEVENPKVNLIAAKSEKHEQLEPEDPNLGQKLKDLFPLKIDRIQVRNGEVVFIDKTVPEFPKIHLRKLDGTVENIATRAALNEGAPTTVAAAGDIQDSGKLNVFVTADPLQSKLNFAGRAQVVGLDLTEFSEMLSSETGLRAEKGTMDVFAEFVTKDGVITGGVKPLLKNVEVTAGKPGLLNQVKAVLADVALDLLSNRAKGEKTVATVIPIHGKVDKPDTQLWPTVIGLLRNAFVLGMTEGYNQLPPPKAQEKEGVIEQAVEGLQKGNVGPKAQPTNETEKKKS